MDWEGKGRNWMNHHPPFEEGSTQQKMARNLGHAAHAVAALPVRCNRAAMRKTAQRGQRIFQHLMRRLIRDARDKAYAAGIMMKAGVKQRGSG